MLVVEQCCHLHEGVIYKYTDDGAIVAWDARSISYKHALQTILEIRDEMGHKERYFAEKYGRPVEFTAGIHSGQVLIGELGDERKEIGYWGDTINTTERIQSSCKEYGVSILLSEDFYSSLSGRFPELVRDLNTERIEGVVLRGKAQGVNLIKIV